MQGSKKIIEYDTFSVRKKNGNIQTHTCACMHTQLFLSKEIMKG